MHPVLQIIGIFAIVIVAVFGVVMLMAKIGTFSNE
jgi:hypothetical protein